MLRRGLINGFFQIKFSAIVINVSIEGVHLTHSRCMIDVCTIDERNFSVTNVNLQQVTLVSRNSTYFDFLKNLRTVDFLNVKMSHECNKKI